MNRAMPIVLGCLTHIIHDKIFFEQEIVYEISNLSTLFWRYLNYYSKNGMLQLSKIISEPLTSVFCLKVQI